MAPVVWGLDLAEIKWSKFGNSWMWNKEYHLRRTKFIIYQCALIFCVISESLGTAVLSDYVDSQKFVARHNPQAYMYNNDYIGAASYNIFAGVFVAFIFGAAFFFDLIWPERKESKGVLIAWKVCGVLACCFMIGSAFTLTIITSLHCGYFRGVDTATGLAILSQFKKDGGTPLCYRQDGRAIAAVVFVWLGMLSTCISCLLLYLGIENSEKGPGPKSEHARVRDAEKDGMPDAEKAPEGQNGIVNPDPTHHNEPDADAAPQTLPEVEN